MAPAIVTGVSPALGPSSGGQTVTITGTTLGTNNADIIGITFGGNPATSIVWSSATSVQCVTPAGTVGTAVIQVTNTSIGAGTETSTALYAWAEPITITSISQPFGTPDGANVVTITGTNLSIASFAAINSIKFGETNATSLTRVDNSSLTCVVPQHAVGMVDVVVKPFTNMSNLTLTSAYDYTLQSMYMSKLTGVSTSTAGKYNFVVSLSNKWVGLGQGSSSSTTQGLIITVTDQNGQKLRVSEVSLSGSKLSFTAMASSTTPGALFDVAVTTSGAVTTWDKYLAQ